MAEEGEAKEEGKPIDEGGGAEMPQRINQDELLTEARGFFETQKKEIGQGAKEGVRVIQVDFHDLSEHSPELAELLIERPEETIELMELALEELEWAPKNARARF